MGMMAGFGTNTNVLTAEMPAVAETMAVTYHFDVSNLHSVKPDEVKTNMAAHDDAQINAMLAMRIGTCGYTVTKTSAPSDATSAATTYGTNKILMPFFATVLVMFA